MPEEPSQPACGDRWYTIKEAAEYLRVTVTTVYRYCDSGRLRYYELETGGGRRFRRADLDRMLRPGDEGSGGRADG